MRSEENSRIQSHNHLSEMIEMCMAMKAQENAPLPEQAENNRAESMEPASAVRNSESKRKSPANPVATQWWKRTLESERRNYSEAGSVIANKFKFSTPAPEMEEDVFGKYKENRRNKVVPKSWDVEVTSIPRIQTAVPSNSKKFRTLAKTNKIY